MRRARQFLSHLKEGASLSQKIDENLTNQDLLYLAIEEDNAIQVKRLLNCKGVDPTEEYQLPIRIAAENGRFESVRALIKDSRVEPSSNNNYAIKSALNQKYNNIVNILFKEETVYKILLANDIDLYKQIKNNQIIIKINNF
jgi:hypothetical protein